MNYETMSRDDLILAIQRLHRALAREDVQNRLQDEWIERIEKERMAAQRTVLKLNRQLHEQEQRNERLDDELATYQAKKVLKSA